MVGEKDKKWVVDSFDGFSPQWFKVKHCLPLILGKSFPHIIICCIDIAGCGFFIKLNIYMMFTNVFDLAHEP